MEKKRTRVELKKAIIVLAGAIFLAYVIFTLCAQQFTISKYQEEKKQIEQKVEQETKESQKLQEQQVMQESADYIEQKAREKLGLVKGNEKVFIDQN